MKQGPEPSRVLFEDEALLAVSKPPGLHVFPSHRGESDSVLSRLLAVIPDLGRVGPSEQPAFVHRLDRNTSGVLLAAKNDKAYRSLRESFETKQVNKEYLALVEGSIPAPVSVDLPLGARHWRSKRVSVWRPGHKLRSPRPAQTHVVPLGHAGNRTLCQVSIRTGVRHQIRAHLAHLGHPVAGDTLYGATGQAGNIENRFFLHALSLGFAHPSSQEPMRLTCRLYPDFEAFLQSAGLWEPSLDLHRRIGIDP